MVLQHRQEKASERTGEREILRAGAEYARHPGEGRAGDAGSGLCHPPAAANGPALGPGPAAPRRAGRPPRRQLCHAAAQGRINC